MDYSTKRARIYYKAAREMRALAVEFLNEIVRPVELTGQTAGWAVSVGQHMREQANKLDELGHEVKGGGTTRDENLRWQSMMELDAAFSGLAARIELARQKRDEKVGTFCECGAPYDAEFGGYSCAK